MRGFAAIALVAAVGCASPEAALTGAGDLAAPAGDDLGAAPDDLAPTLGGGGDGAASGGCAAAEHVVINELKTGGTSSASDEFVELFNPCALPVDLTGSSLVYRSQTGTSDVIVINLTKTIDAHGYLLIAGPAYSNGGTPDQTYGSGRFSGTAGGVAIRDGAQLVVDSVGYGSGTTNAFVEGAPAPAPAAGQSIARTPSGIDTNHNDLDFAIAAVPTPREMN